MLEDGGTPIRKKLEITRKKSYIKHAEKRKAASREWYAKNPERAKVLYLDWRRKNRARRRDINLKHKYGIPYGTYDRLLNAQSGCCGICGLREVDHHRFFDVDHNHETEDVRGLLCNWCNRGLGHFKDSLHRLKQAVVYLEQHEK